jgi:hypothetical protein
MTVHVNGLRFSLHPLMAEARRRMVKRRALVAVFAVLTAGGVAGAALALTSSSAVQPAGPCPVTGGYYAYAVPDDPAHPPAAGSGATSWGWTPRERQIKVGNWLREDGRLWRVTEIAAMPGVESVGRPFGILGWQPPSPTTSLTMCGRLVFQPVG